MPHPRRKVKKNRCGIIVPYKNISLHYWGLCAIIFVNSMGLGSGL